MSREEVAARCGVVKLTIKVRQRKLKWSGHVKRREGINVVGMEEEIKYSGGMWIPREDPEKLGVVVSGKTWKSWV